MIIEIRLHEKSKGRLTKSLYNIDFIIQNLESEKLTPEAREKLQNLKELRNQLNEQGGNLIDMILEKDVKKARTFSRTQSARASKPRKRKDITPEQREKRNIEICKKWRTNLKRKYPLSKNSFAVKQSKQYPLSITQVKNIIRLSE